MHRLCMMNVPEVEQLDGVWVKEGCVGELTVAVILTEWVHNFLSIKIERGLSRNNYQQHFMAENPLQ